MKDKFKIIIIILAVTFLSLYAWNLFLYSEYGGIGRYQAQTAIGQGIIDTKTGHIFMPARPSPALEAERWYYIDPIRLEDEGFRNRLSERGRTYLKAGFTSKEIEDYFRLQRSYRTGLEKVKRPKIGLTREEIINSEMMDLKMGLDPVK